MSFNPDPNKQLQKVYFSRKIQEDVSQMGNGFNVDSSSSQKHIGLVLDEKLNLDKHIEFKISMCNKLVGLIKILSAAFPRDALSTTYESFIRAHLDHAEIMYNKPKIENV